MPTVRGWVVLAGGVALAVGGFAAGYRELVMLGVAALVCLLLAAGWVGAPPRLSAERTIAPDRVSRDGPCQVTVDLHSVSGRTTLVTIREPVTGPEAQRMLTVPARVRGGLPTRVRYELPTGRRGVLTVGPLQVGRRDPLGLCAAQRQLAPPARVLVRPLWRHLTGLPLGAVRSLDGLRDTAMHGTIAFHTLREYRFGDELRRVHWRTSARLGTLVVREHVDTALPRLAVLVDDRAESYVDDIEAIEEVAEAAASMLAVAGRDGLPMVLRTASRATVATTVESGLDLLAQVSPTAGVDLGLSLHGLPREYAGDTLVVFAGPAASLGPVLAVHDTYASLVVVLLGKSARAPSLPDGALSMAAASAVEFAERWNRTAA